MKIKKGYLLREAAGTHVAVPVGKASMDLKKMITLSETGALLWAALEKGADEDGLVGVLLGEYDVEESVARRDVAAFLEKLRGAGLIEE